MTQKGTSTSGIPVIGKYHIKIMQINLNHCKNAQDLLIQTAEQLSIDVVMISEPWKPPSYWFNDDHKNASIWTPLPSKKFKTIKSIYKSKGITAIQLNDYVYISCYVSPNISISEYTKYIMDLESFLNTIDTNFCIIAGDFNAKSPAWGSSNLDERGILVMETCNNRNLKPTISQGSGTFERNGHTSTIDILLCGIDIARNLSSSRILEKYTASDHKYILHVFTYDQTKNEEPKIKRKINPEKFMNTYQKYTEIANPLEIASKNDVDAYIKMISEIYENTSYLLPDPLLRKKSVWWWNPQIAEYRKKANTSRRALQRARSWLKKHPDKPTETVNRLLNEHKMNKKNFKT